MFLSLRYNICPRKIQLFRERLSVKAKATILKGFMGNGCLLLPDQVHSVFARRKKNLRIYVHMLSPSVALKQREDRLSNRNWHYP